MVRVPVDHVACVFASVAVNKLDEKQLSVTRGIDHAD